MAIISSWVMLIVAQFSFKMGRGGRTSPGFNPRYVHDLKSSKDASMMVCRVVQLYRQHGGVNYRIISGNCNKWKIRGKFQGEGK